MWPPAPLGAHGVGFGDVNDARRRRDRADPPRRGQLVSPPARLGRRRRNAAHDLREAGASVTQTWCPAPSVRSGGCTGAAARAASSRTTRTAHPSASCTRRRRDSRTRRAARWSSSRQPSGGGRDASDAEGSRVLLKERGRAGDGAARAWRRRRINLCDRTRERAADGHIIYICIYIYIIHIM